MSWTAAEMDAMNAYHARMEAAFKLVENHNHWKGPIAGFVPKTADIAEVVESIRFFTATEGTATPLPGGGWWVTAPGYWAGPAN